MGKDRQQQEKQAYYDQIRELVDIVIGTAGLSEDDHLEVGRQSPQVIAAFGEIAVKTTMMRQEIETAHEELAVVRQEIDVARQELEGLRQTNESLVLRNNALMHDPNTGLLNDVGFHEEVDRLDLSRLKCVLILDARGLKYLNDNVGYLAGDAMLQGIANALKENLREADIIARHGGDEFCVVFDIESEEEAQAVVDRLSNQLFSGTDEAIRCQIDEEGTEIYLNARATCAFAGGDSGKDVWQAMKDADRNIRRAKQEENKTGVGRGSAGSVSFVPQNNQ